MPLINDKPQFEYAPNVGKEAKVFKITKYERIQNPSGEGNYKDKNKEDLGYYDVFHLEEGKKLKCNTWRLYFAIRDIGAEAGDTIKIEHPARGEFIITKVTKVDNMTKTEWEDEEN